MNSCKNHDLNGYRQVKNPFPAFVIPKKKGTNVEKCKNTKIHRHYAPKYTGVLPKIVPIRRFAGALKRHDWNRNSFIYQLRCDRNQRVSIRSERRETFSELALAMIAYADYNPNHEYIFEVMCSVEKLAELCGQLYRYENGRKSYDPILHALNDWEHANLIVIDRDFDVESKQYKAMRIWIRPEFFIGLGFSLSGVGSGWGRNDPLSFRLLGPKIFASQ
ncbi:hypothetical protein [Xenorhabdus cabanillasii]|uniref:hypothetical protein n=1 Tax=Xenorhabdus cabanillasii TaxID=351673 RepID=UPI000C063C34|nr:hypothetical protein [Xenorhabdus cabanillasii]PHM75280.1 hypothetical protein Xcab_04250 [Xenorhabdus cabanillasii JM26]